MTTATNPGLTAYIRAHNVLKDVCEQTAKFLLDHSYGTILVSVCPDHLRVLHRNLIREMAAADKLLDDYAAEVLAEDGTLTKILDQLDPDDIDEKVHRMDIVDVARYARANDIGDWEITTWTDDMWPEKDQELREAVAQHMMQEKGV